MREWLKKMLKEKEEARAGLKQKGQKSTSVEEVRSIGDQIEVLDSEIAEFRSQLESLPDDEDDKGSEERGQDPEVRGAQPQSGLNVLGTYGMQVTQQENRSGDQYDTTEYRSAFMEYVTKGVQSNDLEMRATTGTGDIGAVIPTTILNRIVEKMKDYGRIWARVTKTTIQAGVEVPTSSAKPTATWVAEGSMSDKQKKTVSGNISFSYHKLQCRVSVNLVADTVSMPVFEQTISDNVYEAMVIALESAIISGSGTGQPLGITTDTGIPESQKVPVLASEIGTYDKWTELFGKMPRSYRNGMVLILNDADWTKYIEGMVDGNGQPIARVNYGLDGTQQERLLGKEVLPIEEYLPSIDDAAEGEVFGVLVKLSDYMVNSNMQMLFKRYFNEDTDEWISKSTLIADGKLADKNGVILLTKEAEV